MNRRFRWIIAAAWLAAGPALAQDTEARPHTYALLSAMGNRFTVVHEVKSTGSHLPPYRRETYEIGQNLLNRLVLQSLDKAVARIDPESKRIYLSTNPSRRRPDSEDAPIAPIVEQLRKLDRGQWDRILVAAPAYRYASNDGLPTRMQGVGIFTEPLCQSDVRSCEQGFRPPSGPEATAPGGEKLAANTYVAPYSFVQVWVLDPKTLAVVDRTATYQHRKLTDESGSVLGMSSTGHREFLNAQIFDLIEASVDDAVEATQLRHSVDVIEKGPATAR